MYADFLILQAPKNGRESWFPPESLRNYPVRSCCNVTRSFVPSMADFRERRNEQENGSGNFGIGAQFLPETYQQKTANEMI
jgi:hypothetical protein